MFGRNKKAPAQAAEKQPQVKQGDQTKRAGNANAVRKAEVSHATDPNKSTSLVQPTKI